MDFDRLVLDLHGFTRDEAVRELEEFLVHARLQGISSAEIITGKGLHSPDGVAVVRNAVLAVLNSHGLHYEFDSVLRAGDGTVFVYF